MKIEIKSVRELIQHLGSQTAVAKKIGLTQGAVSQWAVTGRIMPKHWKAVIKIAGELGFELTAEDLMQIMLREHRNRGVI
jgi:hypothetical protein